MQLKTRRLILRQWRDEDLPAFAEMNGDPRVMEHFPGLMSVEESNQLATRIRLHFDKRGFGLWAVEVPEVAAFVGFVGLSVPQFETSFTPCVEVGWRIAQPYWNEGYATEAASAAVRHGFIDLDLAEIVSFTVPANRASRRVMEKIGMSHSPDEDFDHPSLAEGHHLRRHVLYRLKKSEWETVNQRKSTLPS